MEFRYDPAFSVSSVGRPNRSRPCSALPCRAEGPGIALGSTKSEGFVELALECSAIVIVKYQALVKPKSQIQSK